MLRPLIMCLLVGIITFAGVVGSRAENQVPVSRTTLYPGVIVTGEMLSELPYTSLGSASAVVTHRDEIIGKMAARTILPRQPILKSALRNPHIVRLGKLVKLRYEVEGLTIQGWAVALEPGGLGDLIGARNPDTGITIRGIVQADGSLSVPAS